MNAILDRLKESGTGPVQLRVLIQARLPRGQGRPAKLAYQRLGSTMLDCRTVEASLHARRAIRAAVQALHRVSLQNEAPAKIDLRAVPWEILLDELDRRGIATVDFESVPDGILRREFGRRLRGNRAAAQAPESRQASCQSADARGRGAGPDSVAS